MATTDAARAFVQQHLGETIAAFPAAVRDTLLDKFLAFYSDPLTEQLQIVLRKRLTDEEVRFLLFAPTPEQFRFYAALLSVRSLSGDEDGESTSETWPRQVRKRFLTLFYLQHASNWPLVVEFIHQDGLQILVDLFMDRDLQVRGQAIDAFVQITSNHVAFEWFESPVGYDARLLHAKMVALARPEARFLRQIVANIRLYEQPESSDSSGEPQRLPGGTFVLLQVLAFFLSWVRKFYTHNELRLSRELLTLLREWKQCTHSDNEEELQLAQQVYEDFSRWPAIEATETQVEGSQHIEMVAEGSQAQERDELFAVDRIQRLLKKAENIKDDDAVEHAIALCTEAIAANANAVAALLSRARAYACRAQLRPTTAADSIRLCMQDCDAVWEREAGNMDAWRCLLEVLATHKMWSEGGEALDAWAETHRDSYLPEDAAFLSEQRAFFDEKAHEQRQQLRSEQSNREASRQAKERQIYELLLHRSGIESTTSRSIEETSKAEWNRTPTDAAPPAPAQRDILARFRSAPAKSTKRPTKSQPPTDASGVQTRALVRKFLKCQRDLGAIRLLLSSSSFTDVASALESSLPDASLVLALEALVIAPDSDGDPALTRVLQHLLSLPRLMLLHDMASPEQQQSLTNSIHTAQALIDSRSSNALAA